MRHLQKIIRELNTLESLIELAEANAEQGSRIRFRYDWLRQELKRVRNGIQPHTDSPRAQSRSFPPLGGDYRR